MLSKQTEKAVDYLNKFSRLMRLVLEHSKNEVITIQQELEALNLYLNIEANRFNEKFSYKIDIEYELDLSLLTIPPLLLQPFAENAIWHGLLQSEKPQKQISISITRSKISNQIYFITIADNGIGIKKAKTLKSASINKDKSLGMLLTQERIKLFNDNFKDKINYQIEDIVADGEVAGTKVIFTIKLNQ